MTIIKVYTGGGGRKSQYTGGRPNQVEMIYTGRGRGGYEPMRLKIKPNFNKHAIDLDAEKSLNKYIVLS